MGLCRQQIARNMEIEMTDRKERMAELKKQIDGWNALAAIAREKGHIDQDKAKYAVRNDWRKILNAATELQAALASRQDEVGLKRLISYARSACKQISLGISKLDRGAATEFVDMPPDEMQKFARAVLIRFQKYEETGELPPKSLHEEFDTRAPTNQGDE